MKKFSFTYIVLQFLFSLNFGAFSQSKEEIIIGSKKFTESVILGEMISQKLNHEGYLSIHKRELGGTRVLWNGLRQGEIDIYVEYTGTMN